MYVHMLFDVTSCCAMTKLSVHVSTHVVLMCTCIVTCCNDVVTYCTCVVQRLFICAVVVQWYSCFVTMLQCYDDDSTRQIMLHHVASSCTMVQRREYTCILGMQWCNMHNSPHNMLHWGLHMLDNVTMLSQCKLTRCPMM